MGGLSISISPLTLLSSRVADACLYVPQAIRTLWAQGNIRGAVDKVAELQNDAAVVADFLSIVSQRYAAVQPLPLLG